MDPLIKVRIINVTALVIFLGTLIALYIFLDEGVYDNSCYLFFGALIGALIIVIFVFAKMRFLMKEVEKVIRTYSASYNAKVHREGNKIFFSTHDLDIIWYYQPRKYTSYPVFEIDIRSRRRLDFEVMRGMIGPKLTDMKRRASVREWIEMHQKNGFRIFRVYQENETIKVLCVPKRIDIDAVMFIKDTMPL